MKRSRYKQPIYPQPCSDNWLNQVKEALTHQNFKITPPTKFIHPATISIYNSSDPKNFSNRSLNRKETANYYKYHNKIKPL